MKDLFKLTLFVVLLGFAFSSSATMPESKTKVQSLYLYNFAKHIKWDNLDGAFKVGIYASKDKFDEMEAILRVKEIKGRSIQVTRLKKADEAIDQNMLFVSGSYSRVLKKLNSAKIEKLLVVSEKNRIGRGAAISFSGDRSQKFEMDLAACKEVGLQISNSLYELVQ